MRKVLDAGYSRGTDQFPLGWWKVFFDDGSVVGVDVSGIFKSSQKTMDCIKSAAFRYSESYPEEMLSGVVINLLAETFPAKLV